MPQLTGVTGTTGSLRMYASSSAGSFGCSSGERYTTSHAMSQRNPIAPVTMNDERQPQVSVAQRTMIGVISAPTFDPALKIPVANARSAVGNHAATVLIA